MTTLTRSRAALGVLAAVLAVLLLVLLVTCGASSSDPRPAPGPPRTGGVEVEVGPPDGPTVESGATPALQPGVRQPLDLTLHNQHSRTVVLTGLTASVTEVRTTRATEERPCGTGDFRAEAAELGELVLPPGIRTSLSGEGVDPDRWPSLTMLAGGHNQDGCKSATVLLEYRATGRLS